MKKAWSYTITVMLAAGLRNAGAQTPPAAILEIEVANTVFYVSDISDYTKFATNPAQAPPVSARNFSTLFSIGDIVSVNGRAAKGTWTTQAINLNLNPNPNPGQAVADVTRGAMEPMTWEILQADGSPVGSIMVVGTRGGPPPPGAPTTATGGNLVIVGGTGAFLGVRGQAMTVLPAFGRGASIAEDPANRRILGGGTARHVLHLIPMTRPEVVVTSGGPAIVHANDFTAVTPAKPARGGELLTLFAAGLGPTRPALNPTEPFPQAPPQIVTSPVSITVNGTPAEVLYAAGYPGALDRFQVNFRLPEGTTPGMASIQIAVAWIAGSEVKISVQ